MRKFWDLMEEHCVTSSRSLEKKAKNDRSRNQRSHFNYNQGNGRISKYHLIKNDGRGTKPFNKFIEIISLLAIELATITNVKPNNNFYDRNLVVSMLCNETSPVGLFIFPI